MVDLRGGSAIICKDWMNDIIRVFLSLDVHIRVPTAYIAMLNF